MTGRWWHPRTQPDAPEILGESGPGKVAVPTRRDEFGFGWVEESVLADPGAADDWDDRIWRDAP